MAAIRRWAHRRFGWFEHSYGPWETSVFYTSNLQGTNRKRHEITLRRCEGCPVEASQQKMRDR